MSTCPAWRSRPGSGAGRGDLDNSTGLPSPFARCPNTAPPVDLAGARGKVGRGAVLYDVGPPERGLYLTAAALLAEARAKELPREWLTAAARMLHRYSPRWECIFVIVEGERWQIQLLKRPGAATN